MLALAILYDFVNNVFVNKTCKQCLCLKQYLTYLYMTVVLIYSHYNIMRHILTSQVY